MSPLDRPTDPFGRPPDPGAPLVDATAPAQPGGPAAAAGARKIGTFEVRRTLGDGSFGSVYLAFDATLRREVAIKVPKAESFSEAETVAFLREARAVADIHHPNICPVYGADVHDGKPYIVMRYVPDTLRKLLDRSPGPLAPRTAAVVASKLALGLVAAHAKGIVHRDLKPANVLYDQANREVLIADFGEARLDDAAAVGSSGGRIRGTPLYMPPEQCSAEWGPVSERSDVYSLGVMLYEMLAKRPPFLGSVIEVMYAHCHTAPQALAQVRPGLDPYLEAVCLRAMAKRAADRYPNARELALALKAFLTGTGSAPVVTVGTVPPNYEKQTVPNAEGRFADPVALPSDAAILIDEAALGTMSGEGAETAKRGQSRPVLPAVPPTDPPDPLVPPVPPPPAPPRAPPVAPRRPRRSRVLLGPDVWRAVGLIGFVALVVAGFLLMRALDKR